MDNKLLPCVVDECNKLKKRGDSKYCTMHRARLQRTSRLDKKSIFERIEENIERVTESGCWIWMGYLTGWGYGRFRYNGKKVLAHRLSFSLYRHSIPSDMLVCHHCDTPSCVNPSHLFIGTHQDNCDDKMRKGRFSNGRT